MTTKQNSKRHVVPKIPKVATIPKVLTPKQAHKYRENALKVVTAEVEGFKHDMDLMCTELLTPYHTDSFRIEMDKEDDDTLSYWLKEVKSALRYYRRVREKTIKAEKEYHIRDSKGAK